MKLQDDIDFTTLNWVKQELDETLKQARQALEAYVEDPADTSLMRFCATYLHQVQGTLRMVELYGAAMVVEEMERLAQGLLDDAVKQREEAYSVLMRGMVQLPDYLERLQSGHKDIPIVLLPLLNDLRASRGEKLLTESVLFAPDLTAQLPTAAAGAAQPLPPQELRAQALRLRLAYEGALLKWIRDENEKAHLERLQGCLDRLRALSSEEEVRRLFWVAAGVAEAIHDGGLAPSAAVKLLFGRVDREIRSFVETGDEGIRAAPPRELVQNLLYYVAHSSSQSERVAEIRRTYHLDTLLPTEKELAHAQGSMTGHNRTLLDTVSAAIKDDLLRVKESLDIFLRTHHADPAELMGQVEVLDRVRDTLGMLGLGVPRRVVTEQREIVEEIANGRKPADEGTLLDVAGALLYVEASLDDHIERLGAGTPEGEAADGTLELPKTEVRKLLDALMREAAVNIQQAKHDIVAFIESPWDHARVEQIPRLLEEIAGALRMLDLHEAAQLMGGIERFVEVELQRHRRVPTAEQMDSLADAVASIEYYLEATREGRGGREKILDVTRESLVALGYWPLPADDGMPPAIAAMPVPPASVQTLPASIPPPAAAPVHETLATAAALAYGNGPVRDVGSDLQGTYRAGEFPSWGEHLPSGRSDGLRTHEDADVPADASLPTIDLPDDTAEPAFTEAPPAPAPAAADELSSAVDIAPGRDLHDLIVGDARMPECPAHDLDGLRLAETGGSALPDDDGWIEIEEEVEEEVPVAAGVGDARFQNLASADIDDEIREVFVEEVQEEIDHLGRSVPEWRAAPDDLERLKPVRRSFHTLKGSGRLVGALALGEFSWKVENMLNRVLDKTIAPGAAVQALVERALAALPELLAALRGEGAPNANIASIMDTADRIAAGEEAWASQRMTSATQKIKRIVRRRVPAPPPVSADIEAGSAFAEHPGLSTSELTAGPLPSVDPVLFDILKSEVAMHLATIDDYVAACEPRPVAASEPLLRAVHTLHGAIAMVEIPVVGQVLGPLEGYVKRLRAYPSAPDAAGVDALRDSSALIREVMTRLDSGTVQLPDSDALVARVNALRDALPEPASSLHLYHDEHGTAEAAPTVAFQAESAQRGTADFGETLAEAPSVAPEPQPAAADEDLTAALMRSFSDGAETPVPAPDLELADLDWSVGEMPAPEPAAAVEPFAADEPEPVAPIVPDTTAARRMEIPAQLLPVIEEPPPAGVGLAPSIDFVPSIEPPLAAVLAAAASHAEARAETAPAVVPHAAEIESVSVEPAVPAASATAVSSAPLAEPAVEMPAIADDPQPEGRLELPDLDEDLLEIFVQEGNDILDHTDSLMARLREAPQERDPVAGLQRDLHTLKGGARMAGLAPIGDLSHVMESLLEAVSAGQRPMDRGTVESLERGFDRLHGLVQRVSRRQAIAMPAHAIARFEALASGTPPEAAASGTAAPSVTPASAPATTVPTPARPAAPRPAPRHIPTFDEEEATRAPQEMIRVRSELLDSLVNYAGEVSIYRSRLEQQISTFRFNLIEFEQTVSRLREQLRKLEIETEAQIIARYQREHHEGGQTVFDPLELDRFSQLQQYSRALGESVSDLVSIQGLLDDLTRQSETLLLQQSRVSSDLQEGLMRTRMVPFDSLVPSLRRTLRQAAQELGKRAQLKVEGAQGEMDRNLLERMKAPFEHMLRNALAHGIESPEDRLKAGKPLDGTVNIAVSREATEVVLRISDDGRGMDRNAIRAKAIERGLMKPDAQLSDRDLYGFITETGFSTAEQVTQIAGRGVGMDVVHNEIKQLGGSLVIGSEHGRGSAFTIRLPFTLAVTQAILVKLGESTYAIPMSSVQGVVRIAHDDFERRMTGASPSYVYAGEEFHIYELSQLLGVPPGRVLDETQLPLLMTRTGDQRAAVRIDAVVGSREIVVKSVGPQISSVPGIFGATIMGDGSVVMILDLAPLVRRVAALRERHEAGEVVEQPQQPVLAPVVPLRRQPLIMVVDDSITMRKVTTRVLERADLEVVTAKDGLDAVEKLQDKVPDLMLLDIEMPRMDGYELATYMKNDPRLKRVPIIMITSRTGEKHRQRALEIGVERYLGKPYQEVDLLRNVQEALKVGRAES